MQHKNNLQKQTYSKTKIPIGEQGMFKKIPDAPEPDQLIDRAFKKARQEHNQKSENKELQKIHIAAELIKTELEKIINKYPNFNKLPQFYYDLADTTIDIDQTKQSLAALNWARNMMDTIISKSHKKRSKKTNLQIRKEAYGRISSILHQIKPDIEHLKQTRKKLRQIPEIKKMPTIVISGYPNVGKSTILSRITSSRPKIETYPFTTKNLEIGILEKNYVKYQIIDTPGILDRPLSKRNNIEKKSIHALKHIANSIIHVIDPTGRCGYPIEKQEKLYQEIKNTFKNTPIFKAYNKKDIYTEEIKEGYKVSAKTGEGIEKLLEDVLKPIEIEKPWEKYQQ
ncbi:GTP-binding protein GTP1/Obg family [Methanonatronarchaeum thermophilum]|uniref:GTP-binding protein GTP1/Obg family n=1 Tax=Methanonatronarchaeum thermophilum TaxID=1927129 RepID=A0A1Y3GBF3_9EURY|nr:GTPase [Methanonatronarchaeum thermophilum]OUJ18570.1 GTP-binding protein GTP1/Obg family [Methanonatronarchaeum thermophilum]